jgi:hypothetical protein
MFVTTQRENISLSKKEINKSVTAQNLLGCTAMFLIECRPMFQRCVLPPSSVLKLEDSKGIRL